LNAIKIRGRENPVAFRSVVEPRLCAQQDAACAIGRADDQAAGSMTFLYFEVPIDREVVARHIVEFSLLEQNISKLISVLSADHRVDKRFSVSKHTVYDAVDARALVLIIEFSAVFTTREHNANIIAWSSADGLECNWL
jgi:hypothetical protein